MSLPEAYTIMVVTMVRQMDTTEQQGGTQSTTQPTSSAVAVSDVTKAYGRAVALRGVNLELEWGRCLVLLGANGAGKSTLLRMLATLVQPDSGAARVAGFDCHRRAAQVRRVVGFLGHKTLLYDDLTVLENLRFYARLYSLHDTEQRMAKLTEEMGVAEWAGRRVRTLSNGMQKRVALVRTLLHRPSVLLLDEPETGLDEEGQRLLSRIVRAAYDGGASVVMTTHNVERGLELAHHVAMLAQGRLVLQAPRREVDLASVQQAFAAQQGNGP